ncbi:MULTISPECIES: alpha/beta hydrolase [unclassified Mycolicibacterium]|uniref:alpha/beta hydrolase n=1 Tax=unclassified Mycolicibacterium TaxID=2636767 RepID=UPI001616CACB|nr:MULTISPECIES: alpha/beta hydrolase [unclassified Mycolicibacterium]
MRRLADQQIHPELRSAARFLPRRVSVTPRTLRVFRWVFKLRSSRRTPAAVEVHRLAPGVTARVFGSGSADRPSPALLWIHGGGYVMGLARQDDELCARFAAALGIVVASVDYRLAPEHPYPVALQDCNCALTWVASLPGVDIARIAIGGASAGGGLAAALALLPRDERAVDPVLQLLVYPMLDDRTGAQCDRSDASYPGWTAASNRFGWQSYLGDADPGVAVPARRPDLQGLAPAWIGVGTLDLFHDEGVAYAQRLESQGVPCTVKLVQGAFHGFDIAAPGAPISKGFFADQCQALRDAFERAD